LSVPIPSILLLYFSSIIVLMIVQRLCRIFECTLLEGECLLSPLDVEADL
jgi:hypothetical protein